MANVSDVVCSDARSSVQQRFAITITISFSIIISVLVNHGDARGEGAIASQDYGVIEQVLKSELVRFCDLEVAWDESSWPSPLFHPL